MDASHTRTIDLSSADSFSGEDMWFILTALEDAGDMELGVKAPVDEEYTIDDYPSQVHSELEQIADEMLIVDNLEAAITEERLPKLGELLLSTIDETTVEMQVEWEPTFIP